MKTLLDECSLEDMAQLMRSKDNFGFTYFQSSSHARLDRVYVSVDVVSEVSDYKVKSVYFSDHSLVIVTLGNVMQPRKTFNWELWKINVKLLKDDTFVERVTQVFEKVSARTQLSYLERWEYIKQEVKELAVERSSQINFLAKKEEKELREYWLELLRSESEHPGSCAAKLKQVKAKLESFQKERYREAVIRSRLEKFLLGEQPTRRALGEEKRFALAKEISVIEHEGVSSKDKAFLRHYQSLFGADKNPKSQAALEDLLRNAPVLTQDAKDWLEGTITEGEVERAIETLPMHKTRQDRTVSAESFTKNLKSMSALFCWR